MQRHGCALPLRQQPHQRAAGQAVAHVQATFVDDALACQRPAVGHLGVVAAQAAVHPHLHTLRWAVLGVLQLPHQVAPAPDVKTQALVPGQVVRMLRCAVALQVGGCGADHPVGIEQPARHHRRILQHAVAQRHVHLVAQQVAHRVPHRQMQFHCRMLLAEHLQPGQQDLPRQVAGCGQPDGAHQALMVRIELAAGLIQQVEGALGVGAEQLALRGDAHAAGAALEQAYRQPGLQPLQ